MSSTHANPGRLIVWILLGAIAISATAWTAGPVTFSLHYKQADLRDVLNSLAAQAGVSLSMDETVSGVVSFNFENLTFDECLQRLAAMFQIQITRDGGYYYLTRQVIRVLKEANDLVTVEFRQARLDGILAELTRISGTNFTLIGNGPTERINLLLNKVPLVDLANYLAEASRCQVEQHNGAYLYRLAEIKGKINIRFEQGRLGLDAAAAPLGVLVREISAKTSLAVIADQASAAVPVTIFITPLPPEEALNALAAANSLRVLREGSIYRFTRGDSPGQIRVRDGLLTMDVRNVEIAEVIAEIARQAKVTIIPNRDVAGRVSGTLTDAPLEAGLTAFLQANGFVLERESAVLYVKRAASTGGSVVISVNTDGAIDLSVVNANLTTVITELAKKKGFGLVVYANVNWNVASVHLRKVGFEEALDRLMAGTTYTYKRDGDTYLVGEGVNLRQGDTDFIQSEVIALRYVQAEAIWNTLPAAFPRQNIILLKDSNSLLVTGTPKLIAALKAFLAKIDLPQEGVRTEVIPLQHMRAEDALKLLPPSIPKTELVVLKETNSIAATGNEGYRTLIREYLKKIDVMAPMILFDVLVLQISQNNSKSGGLETLGIEQDGQKIAWDLGSLVGTIISPGTPAAFKLTATIKAAVSDGLAKVRANPKITTLSGTPAHFDVVTKYNYSWPITTSSGGSSTTTTEYKNFTVDSGIQLIMTPWVSASKEITLELKPKISQYTTSPTEGVGNDVTALPGVMERSTQSTVRIMDGYTVIISGFIQESEEMTESRIPILGSIPILGHLFKSTTKTKRQDEFVIIITPRLIEDPAQLNKLVGEVIGPGSTPEPIRIDLSEGKKKDPEEEEKLEIGSKRLETFSHLS